MNTSETQPLLIRDPSLIKPKKGGGGGGQGSAASNSVRSAIAASLIVGCVVAVVAVSGNSFVNNSSSGASDAAVVAEADSSNPSSSVVEKASASSSRHRQYHTKNKWGIGDEQFVATIGDQEDAGASGAPGPDPDAAHEDGVTQGIKHAMEARPFCLFTHKHAHSLD